MLRYTHIACLEFILLKTIHQNSDLKLATFYFHVLYNVWKPLYLIKLFKLIGYFYQDHDNSAL
jgi:hypothetical protein